MNIIDHNSLLTTGQVSLLQDCSKLRFKLGSYNSLDDILTKRNIDVIIEPGINEHHVPDCLKEALEYWRDQANYGYEELSDEVEEARKKYRQLSEEVGSWRHMRLRGLYNPEKNTIILYPQEMACEYNGSRMDELLVSTLAHETMHAYFNRRGHSRYPYVPLVEEPLAEFGMLLYLRETGSTYYQWSYNDVSHKYTFYHYGANLMDRCLTEGAASTTRSYMEAYKIQLDPLMVPEKSKDGAIDLPAMSGNNSPVKLNGNIIRPMWKDFLKYPPRYFYDAATKTLGLDGCWESHDNGRKHEPFYYDFGNHGIHIDENDVKNVYLGDNFYLEHGMHKIASLPVTVSPNNKYFYSKKGIPFFKRTNEPALLQCGKGLYKICRNGKWGVINDKLEQVILCKYGYVWRFDNNDLILVRSVGSHLYGLVNMQGEEQVPLIYDDIDENQDGTYSVKKNGQEFVIDKDGNTISSK